MKLGKSRFGKCWGSFGDGDWFFADHFWLPGGGKSPEVTSYPVVEFGRALEEESRMQRKSLETWELLGGILWLWPSLLNLFTLTYAF